MPPHLLAVTKKTVQPPWAERRNKPLPCTISNPPSEILPRALKAVVLVPATLLFRARLRPLCLPPRFSTRKARAP